MYGPTKLTTLPDEMQACIMHFYNQINSKTLFDSTW